MNAIVSVKNLSKSFSANGQRVKALDSVSISINKGEIFGLLGPNGAGKTTLISILIGFLSPDAGSASILGFDCTSQSNRIKERMNFASGFGGISEMLSARELLTFYCMVYGIGDAGSRVKKALTSTGLWDYRDRIAYDLSSGLGRRFLISKALLNDPEVLLLDEPTVGLDVESATNLREMIREMKNQGRTILLTTHNMREAEELCDRVALIKDGSIIACGAFPELRKRFFPYDVIEIQCDRPSEIEKLVKSNKSVARIKTGKNCIVIYVSNGSDVGKILRLVAGKGGGIHSINTIEPELEDVYNKVIRGGKDA